MDTTTEDDIDTRNATITIRLTARELEAMRAAAAADRRKVAAFVALCAVEGLGARLARAGKAP